MLLILTTHTKYEIHATRPDSWGRLHVNQLTTAEARKLVRDNLSQATLILDVQPAASPTPRKRRQLMQKLARTLGFTPLPLTIPNWSPAAGEGNGIFLPMLVEQQYEAWPRAVTAGDLIVQYREEQEKFVSVTVEQLSARRPV